MGNEWEEQNQYFAKCEKPRGPRIVNLLVSQGIRTHGEATLQKMPGGRKPQPSNSCASFLWCFCGCGNVMRQQIADRIVG